MARQLIGTVQMREDRTVCVKPDGQIFAIGGKPASFIVAFGGLFAHDVDKQIFRIDGHFYMENVEQRARRLGR